MSNRNLAILGIVAAVMVMLTVLVQRLEKTGASVGPSGGGLLIQGLDTAEIAGIVIGAGEQAVKLARQGAGFVVASKGDYPAVTRKINNLLATCMTVRTLELVTSDPDNHQLLEVSEEKARSVVRFLDKDKKVITGMVVGKTESQTNSTYVRQVLDDDVYRVKEAPRVQSSALDYVEKEIVDVDRDKVVRVRVTGPNSTYTLKVEDGKIELENLPEGKKFKESEGKQVFGALSSLSFSDVRKESGFAQGLLKFDRTYVSELKDSTVYTFDIAQAEGKTYAKVSSEFTDKSRVIEETEDLKEVEARLLAREEAGNFTRRHQGWVYTIADWKAKNLIRELAELIEDVEPEQDQAKEAGAGQEDEGSSAEDDGQGKDASTGDGGQGAKGEQPAEGPSDEKQ